MTDHFAVLNQPRRPWLDPAALKDHFHHQTSALHPDIPITGDAARFGQLNAAYQVLRDPAARLRHLVELEASPTEAPGSVVPPEIAARFMSIATLRQAGEALIKELRNAPHALQNALLTPRRIELQQQLAAVLGDLDGMQRQARDELQAADAAWQADRASALALLPGLQAQFTFLAKWMTQLQELKFQLGTADQRS